MAKPVLKRVARAIGPDALTQILSVTRKLAAPFDIAAMLGEVVRAAKEVLGADHASLWLYEKDRHELVMRVSTGMEPIRISADKGFVGECVRTRALINVPDCYADARFNPEVDRHTGYKTRCMVTLPLIGHDDALVGVLQVLNKRDGVFDDYDEEVAGALAAQCAVALQRVQMTEQLVAGERLKQEIAVARELQSSTLPSVMPAVPGYEVYAMCQPAEETGGDTFDFVPLPANRLFLMLGDATGHGIGPALSVTQMQAMLRLAVRLGTRLDDAYRHVNNQLASDLPPERFITAFLGLLDATSHVLEFHSPGQGPVLHLHAATGTIDRCLPTTFPLGAFAVEHAPAPLRLALEPGDIVAVISDGIFEWPDAADAEFGVERVEVLLREHRRLPPEALAARILAEAAGFGAAQADDVTLLLLRRQPAAAASMQVELVRRSEELERAVALVQQFWQAHRLPEPDRYAVDFAIEEIFTNMVKYGLPGPTRVLLRLVREADAVAVALVDPDSERFDPTVERKVDLDAPIEARQPGGLGLPLIKRMVDDFAYEYAGRESRISFRKRTGG